MTYVLCRFPPNFATFCLTPKNIYVFVLGRKILENHCRLTHNNISAFVLGSKILENRFHVFVRCAFMKAIEKTPISPVVETSIHNSRGVPRGPRILYFVSGDPRRACPELAEGSVPPAPTLANHGSISEHRLQADLPGIERDKFILHMPLLKSKIYFCPSHLFRSLVTELEDSFYIIRRVPQEECSFRFNDISTLKKLGIFRIG